MSEALYFRQTGREKNCLTGRHKHFAYRIHKAYKAVETHEHGERIGTERQLRFAVHNGAVYAEVVAAHYFGIGYGVGWRIRFQVVVEGEIDGVFGQFGVQLSRIAVGIAAVVVVYTVCYIAVLLYLGQ